MLLCCFLVLDFFCINHRKRWEECWCSACVGRSCSALYPGDGMKDSGLKLHQWRFRLNIRKHSYAKRVLQKSIKRVGPQHSKDIKLLEWVLMIRRLEHFPYIGKPRPERGWGMLDVAIFSVAFCWTTLVGLSWACLWDLLWRLEKALQSNRIPVPTVHKGFTPFLLSPVQEDFELVCSENTA